MSNVEISDSPNAGLAAPNFGAHEEKSETS